MTLSIEEITERRELLRYVPEWNELCLETPGSSLFDSYDWIMAWLDAFWLDKPIAFVFVRNRTHLIGCLPLVRDLKGELWCCAGSLVTPVNHHSMRTGFLVSGDWHTVALAIFQRLTGTEPRLRVAFKSIPAASVLATALPGLLDNRSLSFVKVPQSASPYIDLSCGKEEYFRTRKAQVRREQRRKRKRIEEAGQVKHLVITSPENCSEGLAHVMEIERNSWKHANNTAFTSKKELTDFYAEFARRAARNGWFRLHLLYFDGQPIAHVYGAVFKNKYYAIKTSYHQEYSKYAPGFVLFTYVLEDAFEQHFDALDFLGDPSRWKNELATAQTQHLDLCFFAANQYRCHIHREFQHHVKPFLKRNAPFFVRIWKVLRRRT